MNPALDAVSQVLTYTLNPLFVPPVTLSILILHLGANRGVFEWVLFTSLVFYILLPVTMLIGLRRTRRIKSFEIPKRKNRLLPLFGGLILSIASIPIISSGAGAAARPVLVTTGCFALVTVAAMILTLRIRFSLHTAGFAGLVSLMTWIYLTIPSGSEPVFYVNHWVVVFCLVLVPVIAWSRVRSGAHSVREVGAGILFGLVITPASLYVSKQLLSSVG